MTGATPLSVSEARAQLTRLVRDMAVNKQTAPIVIGSHRKPQAILVPYGFSQLPSIPSVEFIKARSGVIHTIARAHKISTVSITGSVARGEATETSDVDFVCVTDPGADLYDLAGFEIDMEQLLGHPVQALSANSLRAPLDKAILGDAIALW